VHLDVCAAGVSYWCAPDTKFATPDATRYVFAFRNLFVTGWFAGSACTPQRAAVGCVALVVPFLRISSCWVRNIWYFLAGCYYGYSATPGAWERNWFHLGVVVFSPFGGFCLFY